jgi:hypothetical protein
MPAGVSPRTSPSAPSAATIFCLQGGEQGQVGAQHSPHGRPLRRRQAQCRPGGLDHLGCLGTAERHPPAGHEAPQSFHALASYPVRVGDVGSDDPAGLCSEHILETGVQAGEHEIELPDHLVGQRHPGGDLAPAMRCPGGLRGQGIGSEGGLAPRTPHDLHDHRGAEDQ